MATPIFITDPNTRRFLANRGYDPDSPRTILDVAIPNNMTLGEQPEEGISGDIAAFGRSAVGAIENTGRGILDLLPSLGRAAGLTDFSIPPRSPSPVEQANPVASGAGSLLGTLATFAVGSGVVGRAPALARLVSSGRAAELGLSSGSATAAPLGLLSGFQPTAMLGRAAEAGASFSLLEALQPGDLDERVARGVEGFARGSILGALGAPKGTPYLKSTLRDSLAGLAAFGNQPIVEGLDSIPPLVQNLAFGAAVGAIGGRKKKKTETVVSISNKIRSKGGPIASEGLLNINESREVFRLPSSPNNERFNKLDSLITSAHEGSLPPELTKDLFESGLVKWVNESRSSTSPKPPKDLYLYTRSLLEPERKQITEETKARLNKKQSEIDLIINNPESKSEYFSPPILGSPIGEWESRFGEAGKKFDEKVKLDRQVIRPLIPSDSNMTRLEPSRPLVIDAPGEQFDPFTGAKVNPTGVLFDNTEREVVSTFAQPARFSRKIFRPGDDLIKSRPSISDITSTLDLPYEKVDSIDLDQFDSAARRRLGRIEKAMREGQSSSRAVAEMEEAALGRRERILESIPKREIKKKISLRDLPLQEDESLSLRRRRGEEPIRSPLKLDATKSVSKTLRLLRSLCEKL